MELQTIGIDLGKTVFHLVGLNLRGEVVVRKKFSRTQLLRTTRSQVNFFMNKFRKLGFIHYNGGLQVHNSLLSVVLHE